MEKYYNGHKIFLDGQYPAIYLPNHPHCKKNGTIRVHILQMEKRLGRFLKKGEVVHHIDKNKCNYNIENLICFKTANDHISFHHGNTIYKDKKEDVYFCKKKEINTCLICNKIIYYQSSLCRECYKKQQASHIPNKEQLLLDIKEMTFVAIGKKYNVSDNAVRKWCKKYNIPYKRYVIKKVC